MTNSGFIVDRHIKCDLHHIKCDLHSHLNVILLFPDQQSLFQSVLTYFSYGMQVKETSMTFTENPIKHRCHPCASSDENAAD